MPEAHVKVLVGMSGGVDSSAAAALLQERGYECTGVTMKLFSLPSEADDGAKRGCCSLSDVEDARAVAFRLNMPHYVLNFSEDFTRFVIDNFVETYQNGGTPNPCIECNRRLKFGTLRDRARALGFDMIATGHYARIAHSGGRFLLKKARDLSKDQSYVLYTMTQEQLETSLFPLGELTKAEVREIAHERGLANAGKRDSQDICFVPDGDYAAFIERRTGTLFNRGDLVDMDGKTLGSHPGHIHYTIGQRRGLGIALNEPRYVIAKNAETNTVTIGREDALYTKSLIADNLNLIISDRLDHPLRVTVKTRYLQKEQSAVVEQIDENTARIVFDDPQRAVTRGQAAVFYDGDIVAGGGTIRIAE